MLILFSLGSLTENSEDAEDDDSDDNVNTDLTQVADAGELLRKGKVKQLTKDTHEYYTSHATSDFRVDVDMFRAAKSVREESWCHVRQR